MPRKIKEETNPENRPASVTSRLADSLKEAAAGPLGRILVILAVVSLVNLAAAAVFIAENYSLRARIKANEAKLAALSDGVTNLQPGWVDSSFGDVQPLGLGLSLVDLKTEPAEAGVKVTGSIINGASLNHSDARFTIIFDELRQARFTVPLLPAGHSASFEAVVPPAGDRSVPKKIRVLFGGSQVSYY